MEELSKSHKGRIAIRDFKITADALALRGYYKPSGKSGQTLQAALMRLSPEIYGRMNDNRSTELKGLEYVLDRLPKGIEECNRVILTAQEELENTPFEKIMPPKRRRISYRVSEKEMAFVITSGMSEVYDVLTHLTFLNIEAHKIFCKIKDDSGQVTTEWTRLENTVVNHVNHSDKQLEQAIWNLSILLGRTFLETRQTYQYLESVKTDCRSNNGLFQIIYNLGKRVENEMTETDDELLIYFTPALREMIGYHKYSQTWAAVVKQTLATAGLINRPLHIISANMHSVLNLIYGYAAVEDSADIPPDLYDFFLFIKDKDERVRQFAKTHGLIEIPDISGANIDCQIIDTACLNQINRHPALDLNPGDENAKIPVLLVMDYAFGDQAFEIMDELLEPFPHDGKTCHMPVKSISIMGKAGILPGKKGDIMLATAHVLEGTPHNYIVHNDLCRSDLPKDAAVYVGPIVTVLGTSLQNRDVLERFQAADWQAVGLEMEGGHYQRAISAAIIRKHIADDVKVRYAYYASDNPLLSGQTLASGSMGIEGVKPTYMITRVIVEKILSGKQHRRAGSFIAPASLLS